MTQSRPSSPVPFEKCVTAVELASVEHGAHELFWNLYDHAGSAQPHHQLSPNEIAYIRKAFGDNRKRFSENTRSRKTPTLFVETCAASFWISQPLFPIFPAYVPFSPTPATGSEATSAATGHEPTSAATGHESTSAPASEPAWLLQPLCFCSCTVGSMGDKKTTPHRLEVRIDQIDDGGTHGQYMGYPLGNIESKQWLFSTPKIFSTQSWQRAPEMIHVLISDPRSPLCTILFSGLLSSVCASTWPPALAEPHRPLLRWHTTKHLR